MSETKRCAIIVLGMHRSGTSALAGMLGLLGARLPARLLPPGADNPKGYFEPDRVVAIHEQLLVAAGTTWFSLERIPEEWLDSAEVTKFVDDLVAAVEYDYADAALFVVKDPRMCRLMPLWRRVLTRVGAQPHFAMPIRNPLEVAQSLQRRDGFPLAHGCLLWLRHVLDAESQTRDTPRVFVQYDELLRDPASTAELVAERIVGNQLALNEKSETGIKSLINPELRHYLAELDELRHSVAFYPWLWETYEALTTLVGSPTDEVAQRRLDGIRALFDPAVASFAPLLAARESALKERDAALATRQSRVASLEQLLAERDGSIAALDLALAERDARLTVLDAALTARTTDAYLRGTKSDFREAQIGPRKIRLIVPFYKNPQLVRPLFDSILESADELHRLGCKVSFINDSPTDEALRRELEVCESHETCLDLRVTTNSGNLGFVKTVNDAFSAAVANDEDVIVLNSDTVLTKGAITELFQVAYLDPMIGFVSPRSNNATICTLPHGSESLDLSPMECTARHRKLIPHLPRVSYVPTAVGFCLFIKSAIIKELGGFDPVYREGYNEENDLIMRANRFGYRAALANHAFVWHKGEQSFTETSIPRSTRQQENAKILNARYPEYQTLIDQYFSSPEYYAEVILGALVPDAAGRLTIGFDFSVFGAYHNGTFEAGKRLLIAAAECWPTNFRIVVFMERVAWDFHRIFECRRAEWLDTHDPTCKPAAIVRVGQPFEEDSVRRLAVRTPVISTFMLDTISADCGYLAIQFDLSIWQFVLQWCDVIFTNSVFTADQFRRRFIIGQNTLLYPSVHSTDPADYLPDCGRLASVGEPAPEQSIFVIGNYFEHKAVLPTVLALANSFPTTLIFALGCKGEERRNVRYIESGSLSDEDIDQLYSKVSAVVFPTHYEGFGFPILNALARGKPIYVRKLAVFEEIVARLTTGKENVRWFESTHDLMEQLSHGIAPWSGPAARGEVDGWRRSATEVLSVIESRLKLVRYEFMVERLRWCNGLFPLSAGGARARRQGVDAIVQMISAKVAIVLRAILGNQTIYSVLRSAWRMSKWIKRTFIAR